MTLLDLTNLWPPFGLSDLGVTVITASGYYPRLVGIESQYIQIAGVEVGYMRIIGPDKIYGEVELGK